MFVHQLINYIIKVDISWIIFDDQIPSTYHIKSDASNCEHQFEYMPWVAILKSQSLTLAVARWPGATRNWCWATKLSKKLHFGGPIGQLKFQGDDVMRIHHTEPNITAIHFRP